MPIAISIINKAVDRIPEDLDSVIKDFLIKLLKKAGFKSTQDYTNVVARYGSEDNYKKGKGLGT